MPIIIKEEEMVEMTTESSVYNYNFTITYDPILVPIFAPIFKIVSNPTVRLSEIKARRFYILPLSWKWWISRYWGQMDMED
ncbi:hypothetical protein LCGC14_1366270 [marine sediment metagenome]|uniref:Uncharacterized protein n=1 Tax=marine sediment metagenome TaxID=412755 RepID=A0A0F9K783_9ZZZZ